MFKAVDLKYNFKNEVISMIVAQAIKESGEVFNLTKHKELWNFLKENPGMEKDEWFDETGNSVVKNYCFACAFSNKVLNYIGKHYGKKVFDFIAIKSFYTGCIACPFQVDCCDCLDGLYDDWVLAMEFYFGNKEEDETLSSLSEQIANYPLREDMEVPVI